MSETVLVVAAHADDEALGCGGTLMRHVDQGDAVHLLFMTNGTGSRGADDLAVQQRAKAAERASKLIGADSVIQHDYPDNAMDSVPLIEVVKSVERTINIVEPSLIYTHFHNDLNVDHAVCNKAVMTACRPQPGSALKAIYAFEVVSSTEWIDPNSDSFVPTVFVDISGYLDRKIELLNIYVEEMRPSPHARSISGVQNLAGYRGHSVGVECAEAFSLIRMLW